MKKKPVSCKKGFWVTSHLGGDQPNQGPGFPVDDQMMIVDDDTDQRMRKMKARARQIIPVTFSSLQQRLQKEFVNNLGLGGKGEWW